MTISAIDYCAMFFSTYVAVFLLGIQSRNVNAGKYVSAVITSFGISASQFLFVKYAAQGSYAVFLTCAIGGCCGIASSIWVYSKFMEKKHEKQDQLRRL